MIIRRNDLTKRIFGRLKVVQFSHLGKNWRAYWQVRCNCGTIKIIQGGNLVSGRSQSCGCLQKEVITKTATKHGKVGSSEYSSWEHMKARCLNKNHKYFYYYGGRGITICDRWLNSFKNFLKDMGEKPTTKHTIDRIKNNEGYCPSNCKWSTRKEQANNKRANNNRYTGKLLH